MKVHHNIGGWLTDEAVEDEEYLEAAGGKKVKGKWVGYGHSKVICKIVSSDELKATSEKEWRDNELAKTLEFIVVPDHPQRDIYLAYRVELYAYDSNGTRPTL